MSDFDALLASFRSGALLRPKEEVPNIVDLSNAIARFGGLNSSLTTRNSEDLSDLIGRPDHLVFVAADGLGMNTVRAMGDDAFIPAHVAGELQTVFPSSTPVVFTSFATGQWPSRHAVIGWNMYLWEIDCVATIIHFQRRSDEKQLGKLGLEAQQAFPLPSSVGDFVPDSLSLLPEGVFDTVYSVYTGGGRPQQGYKTMPAAVDVVLARVKAAKAPTFTYVYSPDVDYASHQYGVEHRNVLAAALALDREVERLVESLPTGSRVVLSADHGLLDAQESDVHQIGPADELVKYMVTEPWGDSRAVNFQVREGQEAGFQRLFRDCFGEHFFLLASEEVEELELYGPGGHGSQTRRRLGNFLAVSKGVAVLKYLAPTTKGEDVPGVSYHSGLTPSEMMVPMIIA